MAYRIDSTRTATRKASDQSRRAERRAKSARIFMALAFGDDLQRAAI